jgi:ribosomal-protein-alanine N-acetyltransferase
MVTGIRHMSDVIGLHRIMANHLPSKVRSERLLRHLGFEREGVDRFSIFIAEFGPPVPAFCTLSRQAC